MYQHWIFQIRVHDNKMKTLYHISNPILIFCAWKLVQIIFRINKEIDEFNTYESTHWQVNIYILF